MDTRGEKLQRARILLRELSSLDVSNIENIDTNKLQELAREYAILSNDSAIKDQFRRMEQNVSIPPVVMQLLERAKDNPASVSSHVSSISNNATAIHAQEMQIQQLRAEYDSMSDYDKKNMSIEDFRKYYKVDSRVIIDNPHRFQEEARRNPSMVYETTYHNGKQMKVYEFFPVAGNELKEKFENLAEEAEQCISDAAQTIDDTYVYLIRTGCTPEEAIERLKNLYGNHSLYQEALSQKTSADYQSLTERANQEGALSDEEGKQQLRRILANINRDEERQRHIIEEHEQLNEVADNLSAGAQTITETGQNLGDPEVIKAGQATADAIAMARGMARGMLSSAFVMNGISQNIKLSRAAVEAQLNRGPNTIAPNNTLSSFVSRNFTFSPIRSGHKNSKNNVLDVNFILDNVNINSVRHVYDSFNDERMAALDQKRVELFNRAITEISNDFADPSVPVEDLAQHVATLKASIVEIKNSPTLSADPEIMAKVQELDEQFDTAILESLPENKREEYSSRLQEALPQQTAYVRSEIDKERTSFNNDLMLEIQTILKRRKMAFDNWQEESQEIADQNAQNQLNDTINQIISESNQIISENTHEITNPHIDSFINDEVDIPDLSEGLVEDPQDFIGANMFGDPFAGSLDEETDLGNTTEFLNGIEEETVEEAANDLPEETRPNAENQDPTNVDINTDSEEEFVVDPQNFGDPFLVNPFSDGYIEENESETTGESQDGEEVAVEEDANDLPEEARSDAENQETTNVDINTDTNSEEELVVDPQNFGDPLFANPFSDGYIEENGSETTDESQDEEEVAVEESVNALPEETRPNAENQDPTNATDQNENRGVSRVLASAGQSVPRDIHINSYQDQYNR